MVMQRSDAAKALRTKTADIAVVKRGSMMLSVERSSAQRMRKSCSEMHRNCRFWELLLAASARRVNAWRRNRGRQPVRSVWISRWKTNHDESVYKPCNDTSGSSCLTLPLVFDAATAWQ